MPAGLEINQQTGLPAAFTVRKPGWWDELGMNNYDDYPKTIGEARKRSGQEWEWITEPQRHRIDLTDSRFDGYELRAGDEEVYNASGERIAVYQEVPKEVRVLRSDTLEHLLTVWHTFEIIGVSEMWRLLEAIAGQPNVRFGSGGVLEGSARIWGLIELDEPWQVTGDPSAIYPYLVFLNSIDSTQKAKIVNTNVRVVCANTFSAADAEGKLTGREFTFTHRGEQVHDRIEEAKVALTGVREDVKEWQEQAEALALESIAGRKAEEAFVSAFIPMPPKGAVSQRVVNNVESDRTKLRAVLAGPTCDVPPSVYKLVLGAGEYLDHERGYKTPETYLTRHLLAPQKAKASALRLARDIAKEFPGRVHRTSGPKATTSKTSTGKSGAAARVKAAAK